MPFGFASHRLAANTRHRYRLRMVHRSCNAGEAYENLLYAVPRVLFFIALTTMAGFGSLIFSDNIKERPVWDAVTCWRNTDFDLCFSHSARSFACFSA
ncbi:MAG: hypothetical protein H6937_05125 [Burkholderiales bacterium]|nr:hypothetical protein [Burkholderiales bacterium]